MERSNGRVRRVGPWARRVVLSGAALTLAASACGERDISLGRDSQETIDSAGNGLGAFGALGGSSGTAQGGMGNVANTGGDLGRGGTFTMGGALPIGGTVSMGGSTLEGGEGGTAAEGGTTPTGGIGGTVPIGGTAPSGGLAGAFSMGGTMLTGGVAGSSGAPPVNADPLCRGIANQMPCVNDGYMCPSLACGLADSGRRQCVCLVNWMCTSCDFTSSVFRDRPANIPPCGAGVADEFPCNVENTVCDPVAGGEVCACYLSPTDGLIWDCDNPPSTWGL